MLHKIILLITCVAFIVISISGGLLVHNPWVCHDDKPELEPTEIRKIYNTEFIIEAFRKEPAVITIFLFLGGVIGHLLARLYILQEKFEALHQMQKIE